MEENKVPPVLYWKLCSLCKKKIGYKKEFYTCSVSSCKSKKIGLIFCSYACWDGHRGMAKHRDAWAEEEISPSTPSSC